MTPAEVRAVVEAKGERRTQDRKFLDLLNGVQCSLTANIHRSEKQRVFTAKDFLVMSSTSAPQERKTVDDLMKVFDRWVMATGGRNG